jgi:hypothetical protein
MNVLGLLYTFYIKSTAAAGLNCKTRSPGWADSKLWGTTEPAAQTDPRKDYYKMKVQQRSTGIYHEHITARVTELLLSVDTGQPLSQVSSWVS